MQGSEKTKGEFHNFAFASTLRELMAQRGISQKELAESICVRAQTVSLYCNGRTQPNVDGLVRIADRLGVPLDYLCRGNTYMEKKSGDYAIGFEEGFEAGVSAVAKPTIGVIEKAEEQVNEMKRKMGGGSYAGKGLSDKGAQGDPR
ncbi:MAG: helix-turn-helix transcriptional regulator [Clostridia bacterium]|nr:helix-turn-helix transcriptional regulator [Clostridia bacterium]